ncbi:MAG: hypothetical protein ACXIVQ_02815 [Acidimicrobiales bacterium]
MIPSVADTAPLVDELRRRRDAVVAGLDGDVLVLSGPPAAAPPSEPARPDHVVTAGWLAATTDLDAAVVALAARLGPDGWLHVVEPTAVPGREPRTPLHGWRLDRDLPASLRRHGFVVTDLERFSMPDTTPTLRPWVQGRARLRVAAVVS